MTHEEAIKELESDKALYIPNGFTEAEAKTDFAGTPDMRLVEALDIAIDAIQEIARLKLQIKGLRKKVNRHKRLIGQLKSELKRYDRETSL